jgi:hypothetical protein
VLLFVAEMATENKVTCEADIVCIKIRINDTLHIRIPRDPHTKIQSWIDSGEKSWVIEVWCTGHSDRYTYDNPELWKAVLDELDKNV